MLLARISNICLVRSLASAMIRSAVAADFPVQRSGGDLASTWALKHQEHSGAHGDLVKNVHFVIGNDYALAA